MLGLERVGDTEAAVAHGGVLHGEYIFDYVERQRARHHLLHFERDLLRLKLRKPRALVDQIETAFGSMTAFQIAEVSDDFLIGRDQRIAARKDMLALQLRQPLLAQPGELREFGLSSFRLHSFFTRAYREFKI